MDTFELPEAMAAEIIEHAFAEFPRECCGIISGPEGRPAKLFRMNNVDPDPIMRYSVDPRQLKEVFDFTDSSGWEFGCIYHSHTHSPAFPSATDVERALYPEAVYALVSLADRDAPDLRAFRILDGTITELRVVRRSEAVPKG
jgi:[CysO sulfur-carrier protein]-S-L-cysteine hydrolase